MRMMRVADGILRHEADGDGIAYGADAAFHHVDDGV